MKTPVGDNSYYGRPSRTGVTIIALAGVISFAWSASAADMHGQATAKAHKVIAKAGHPEAGSRVFGAKTPKHAPTPGHGRKLTSTDHSNSTPAKSKAGHASHWAYAGKEGPDHWGSLKDEYALCGVGKMQSPVDLSGGLAVAASDIGFNYKMSDLTIRNNGHTIQVDYKKGSHIVVNGQRFALLQFHFHTPSEHLINGKKYPMEMHLVHKDAGGALAVVGVMMELGTNNIALAEVADHLPKQTGAPTRIGGVAVNVRDLLPETGSYHHYKGSLTTPPCSEGVNWFVLAKPIQVSAAQIRKFTDIMGDNARPAQAAHNRLLVSSK